MKGIEKSQARMRRRMRELMSKYKDYDEENNVYDLINMKIITKEGEIELIDDTMCDVKTIFDTLFVKILDNESGKEIAESFKDVLYFIERDYSVS